MSFLPKNVKIIKIKLCRKNATRNNTEIETEATQKHKQKQESDKFVLI
jgi:hypothetical protein